MEKLYCDIVKDDRFSKLVCKARDENKSHHIETGFVVARRFMDGEFIEKKIKTPEFTFSNVITGGGSAENGDHNAIHMTFLGMGNADGCFDSLFTHFHGKLKEYCPPSASDLIFLNETKKSWLTDYGIKINPVSIVAHYDSNGRNHLLAFQEKNLAAISEDMIDRVSNVYEDVSYSNAARILTDRQGLAGIIDSVNLLEKTKLYNTAIISSTKKGISNEDVKKLRVFSNEYEIVPGIFDKLDAHDAVDQNSEKLIDAYWEEYDRLEQEKNQFPHRDEELKFLREVEENDLPYFD